MFANVLSFSTEETRARLYDDFRLASTGWWHSESAESPADFADFLFESMALRWVLADLEFTMYDTTFREFAPMTRIGPLPGTGRTTRGSASAPVRFGYRPDDADADARRTTVVVGSVRRRIEWRAWELCPPPAHLYDAWNHWRPWGTSRTARRRRIVFDRVEDLGAVDWEACYCPASAADSLFDAYIFVGVAVWAVQIATKPWEDHSVDAGGGFDRLVRLRDLAAQRWSRPGSSVDVKYVIVVPYEEPGFGVEWRLPARFEEYPGEVFIQFLDVDVFGGRVADVLGVAWPADVHGG